MAMMVGDASAGTGLAGVVYTQLQTVTGFTVGTAGEQMANAIAHAIVTYIQDHASVTVTLDPTGLLAPPMGGPVTGTATATGTVS